MLTMFGAEIIGNSCSESRKRHFWRPEIQKFSGGACPRTPLVKSASGARLSIGRAVYTKNLSMQKGWLRPCCLYSDMISLFRRPVPELCMITNEVMDNTFNEWKMNVNFSQSLVQAPKR